ncbi:MAG: GNAT family N-acetyltransferase [Planctomycetota bacterium]
MSDVSVQRAEPADTPAWKAMREQLGPEWFTEHFDEIARAYFETGVIDNLRHAVFMAKNDQGEPIGFLEGWLVLEHARGRGVGRGLVEACEAWARSHGCREFASDAEIDNEPSARAHAALGFREVARLRAFLKPLG